MLLLDEPFGALDALTRGTIQDELLRICAETHQTVFMITHDVDEAILLADRILLMSNGPQARVAEIVRNTMPRDRAARHAAPRPAVLPHPQPPGRLPRRAQRASCRTAARQRMPPEVSPGLATTRAASTPRHSRAGTNRVIPLEENRMSRLDVTEKIVATKVRQGPEVGRRRRRRSA